MRLLLISFVASVCGSSEDDFDRDRRQGSGTVNCFDGQGDLVLAVDWTCMEPTAANMVDLTLFSDGNGGSSIEINNDIFVAGPWDDNFCAAALPAEWNLTTLEVYPSPLAQSNTSLFGDGDVKIIGYLDDPEGNTPTLGYHWHLVAQPSECMNAQITGLVDDAAKQARWQKCMECAMYTFHQ